MIPAVSEIGMKIGGLLKDIILGFQGDGSLVDLHNEEQAIFPVETFEKEEEQLKKLKQRLYGSSDSSHEVCCRAIDLISPSTRFFEAGGNASYHFVPMATKAVAGCRTA
jgi:hypothetical protein